jgi:hypothetical protein
VRNQCAWERKSRTIFHGTRDGLCPF